MNEIIVIDSREKPKAITRTIDYFDKHGIKHISSKMYVGDYQLLSNGLVVIDRKQNLVEVANNATKGHERFKRELERLKSIDAKMYILVEEKLDCLEDVQHWESPRKKDGSPYTKLQGSTLYKILASWQHRHNIEFVFCHKNGTARKILELLEVDIHGTDSH